jgi:hypothetical protein
MSDGDVQNGKGVLVANSFVNDLYDPKVSAARARFEANAALMTVLSPNVGADLLELFFVHFCALGVQMTEPVDGWIRRAGERTAAIGLTELGRSLVMHAKHEAGHHLMMIDDTRKLVERWNARHATKLDANALLATPATPGIASYVALHEKVIAGGTPYAQLAIEYEIERLSVTAGPHVLKACATVLGKEALAGLSFLEEHVAVDVGHTKFNELQLDRLLAARPDFASPLGEVGSRALDAYGAFLGDCLVLARSALALSAQAA